MTDTKTEILGDDPESWEQAGDPATRAVEKAGQSLAARQEQDNVPAQMTPMAMLDRAVSQGADITVLEKLMGLQERWEANQARKAFDQAMAAAKAEIPEIEKNRLVDYTGKTGIRTHYRHEDLAGIAKVVNPILSEHGLSYRYRTETAQGIVTVTCIVSHRDGHAEENTLSAGHDQSGNKNSIQAVGSTITYLQRYTLKAALGLAASNDDDGGKADQTADESRTLDDEQVKTLRRLIDETETDIAKFCEIGGLDSLPDMLAKDFPDAKRLLEQKKARIQKENAA